MDGLIYLRKHENDPQTCQFFSSSLATSRIIVAIDVRAIVRYDDDDDEDGADRSILHGHRRDRARQFSYTLVPAQSRRGDWEILWTDGSGSRLVLLLLLRPLAPSIGTHTVRGKRRGKRDASKWAAMRARRIEERRKRWIRMLELSTGCPLKEKGRDGVETLGPITCRRDR